MTKTQSEPPTFKVSAIDRNAPYFAHDANPRSVYIHIPFCRHRCGYCNFALVAGRDQLIDPFLDSLETEIHRIDGMHEIDTLFFGGGTPSHLSRFQMGRLGEIVSSRFVLADAAEVSAECNPSDITRDKLDALQGLGVNRISLGVQSFNTEKLKRLERDHDGEIAKRAFELSLEIIGNVSMDLIFAAPSETFEQWQFDLETAIGLGPSHLSTYELTWEKGTSFWSRKRRGELSDADEDLRLRMYQAAIDRCSDAGLQQYEVSSFATAGRRCQHNIQYWLCNPWFAFGPGAAGFINGVRSTNHRSTSTWIKRIREGQSAIHESEHLSDRERAIERLIFGLRMVDGINVAAFEASSNCSLRELAGTTIDSHIDRGLMEIDSMLKLTPAGMMISDSIACEFL